ncbi:hypothetical protein AGMMS50239_41530 [Bacteroidia bacterium]|nr:hypothetical protein AGMMS50239_41530 [Bacteroidia bacterium]
MHGNVSEWCSDWFDYYYGSGPVTDPTGPPDPAWDSERVLRGGGYDSEARFCRSAFRYGEDSSIFLFNIGFRVVFVP